MKSFIKEKLRLVLEGRLGSAKHTPSNSGSAGKVYIYSPAELMAEIANANKLYRSNSAELGSVNEGNGLYEFVLYPVKGGKFAFGGKQTSLGKKEPGEYKDSQGGKSRYLYIQANKGIIHPEYELDYDDEGERHSPMNHAKVKMLFFMGKDIMDFIDGNLGYDDGKAKELAADKMSDERKAKQVRQDLERKIGSRVLDSEWAEYLKTGVEPTRKGKTHDADVSDKRDEKAELLKQKVRAKGKDRRDIVNKIKNLEAEISRLENR